MPRRSPILTVADCASRDRRRDIRLKPAVSIKIGRRVKNLYFVSQNCLVMSRQRFVDVVESHVFSSQSQNAAKDVFATRKMNHIQLINDEPIVPCVATCRL
jgi:hypothetical protein